MNVTEHMSKQYDADLAALRSRLVEMGGLVEEQFRLAVEALAMGHFNLAEQVIANDAKVNALEVEIDNDCARVIAKRQPAAGDLRMILGATKMVTDLERIGDKARKIARLCASIRASDAVDELWLSDIKRISDQVRGLLRESINALVRADVQSAIATIKHNKALAKQTSSISNALVKRMSETPSLVPVLMDMISVTKAVDRVADHASNMSEHLIYIIKGTDVRHTTLEQIEKEALQR